MTTPDTPLSNAVFRRYPDLRLTAAEITHIQAKLPQAENERRYADAVFEGGGVKGTAFLGALRCFDDVGLQWRKLAGTSAGAITAAMVAAQIPENKLEEIIGGLNYQKEFLTQKTSWLIRNGSPADDLQNPMQMLLNLFVARQLGQYSSAPFRAWMDRHLQQKVFADVRKLSGPWYEQSDLNVVVSDVGRGEMVLLPRDLPEQEGDRFSVAQAVLLSMSIPFFFEPGDLNGSVVVDGGLLSNFPLWIYDAPDHVKPKCPTFGFRLVEPEDHASPTPSPKSLLARNPYPIKGIADLVIRVFATMQVAQDRRYLREQYPERVIDIDTLGISTTQFDLSENDKQRLYVEGYQAAKTFLLDQWSWQQHLANRGFDPTA